MAEVYPFKALTLDAEKFNQFDEAVLQTGAETAELSRDHLPNSEPVITRAHSPIQVSHWIEQGVLRTSEAPAYFAYSQNYEVPGQPGFRRMQKGFIGLGNLENESDAVSSFFEEIPDTSDVDRVRLLEETRAQFDPILMLYSDSAHVVDALLDEASLSSPALRVTDNSGGVHSLWRIDDPARVSQIRQSMSGKRLTLAAGHRSYKAALDFRNMCRAGESKAPQELSGYEKAMMLFVNLESDGLMTIPAHRLIDNLPNFDLKEFIVRSQQLFNLVGFKFFTLAEKEARFREFLHELHEVGQVIPAIGMRAAGTSNFYLMKLKATLNLLSLLPDVPPPLQKLDVVILNRLILEKCLGMSRDEVRSEKYIRYAHETETATRAVDQKEAQLCFYLNPTPLSQIREIAFTGVKLPIRAVDFCPKMRSGLTVYSLDIS